MASGYSNEWSQSNSLSTVKFRIYYTTSYNPSNNTSTVTVYPQLYPTAYYSGHFRFYNGSVYGNGSVLRKYTNMETDYMSSDSVQNAWNSFNSSFSFTVNHDSNGRATFTVGIYGEVVNDNMSYPWTQRHWNAFGSSASNTITITENAASTIASSTATVTTGGTYNLTMNRTASSNYHIATFKYNNSTVLYTSDRFDTSLSFSVPRSWFTNYSSIASLPITVSVQTYNSGGTAIGSPATASLTVTADADMKPVVSTGWATLAEYNTGAVSGFTGYVKGYSKAEATFDDDYIDMSNAVGATIASYSVTCQGETDSTSPYLTPILASTSVSVTCTVTDTRGRTASETFTLSVEDYANPILTGLNVIRSNSLGVADEDGQYFKATATATFSSVDSQNSCSLTVAAAPSGGSYGAENTMAASAVSGTSYSLTFGGSYSPDTSYTIRITATDTVGNVTYWYATIPTRKWAMKFRVTNNEVAGVAFGKAAETDDIFEITDDWELMIEGQIIKPVLTPSAAFAIPASGSSVSYDMDGLTSSHELARWNFSTSAENAPPVDLTWTTYDGYFTISNTNGTTTETIKPVFVYPASVTLTAH